MASFKAKFPVLQEPFAKNHRGGPLAPPAGRGLIGKEVITSEREARSEFLLIYTKNLSMSGRPAGRGHAFERRISLEP